MRDVTPLDNLKPPATLSLAQEAMNRLSHWLTENPVIEDADQARQANEVFGSTQRTLRDLDDERHIRVDPLTEQVSEINTEYRIIRGPLERSLEELKRRITDYVRIEEQKRAQAAATLRAEAEARERIAREAEAREADAVAAVDTGVCEDVGSAIDDADAAFLQYERAERAARTAEKNITVRLHDRFGGKARSMKTTEVLVVSDAAAVLNCLGVTEKIADAIVSEAKAYRKQHGKLPPGITAHFVRSM